MKLNHINLPVEDVAATRDFLVKYFGFEILEEKGRDTLCVLSDQANCELTVER
ncbi:MAG TPA: VOC family protein [Pirellulales bacterium]|nr:VOC family protein [Pirellulales bacterium]